MTIDHVSIHVGDGGNPSPSGEATIGESEDWRSDRLRS